MKTLFERVFNGSDEMFAKAEEEVNKIVAEVGRDAALTMPSTFVTVRAMFSHGPEPCAQARTRPFGGRPFSRPGACRMGGVYSCWPQPLS